MGVESLLQQTVTDRQKDATMLLRKHREAGQSALDEKTGKELLAQFGLRVPRSLTAFTADETAACAADLTAPFVVKVLSSKALHKSDLGGVRLNLPDADAVREAARAIQSQWNTDPSLIEGFLVEEMAPAGHELVVGGFVDPQFGPMIMVGLGGVFVEIFADVAFRVCPIEKSDAYSMLAELRARPILQGARGRIAASEEAIAEALVNVGGADGLLMQCADEIKELDINPLIVGPDVAVAVDARVMLAQPSRSRYIAAESLPPSFEPLFLPKTIAVAGVSSSGQGAGNRFIANLRRLSFSGSIYPIHPSADEVEGLKAYRSFAETPEPVDYAYIAVPRGGVPELLVKAGRRVRFAQIMTSGFAESGTGPGSQHELLQAAQTGGVRVLGPNCLGTFSPRGRVTFAATQEFDYPEGHIGVISQSGGFGVDLVRTGQARGLRFSGLVTIGNSIDIGPNDLLEHFLTDHETRVIGMYLEDIRDGRRFFELLRAARGKKPVVVLKGGRTGQGQKAAASHTGALVGDARVWQAVAAQTGCLLVNTIEELIEVLMLFQTLERNLTRPTRQLALFGNGGGASVVASDGFAEQGFSLAEFEPSTRAKLDTLQLPDGASGGNPIDLPANAFNRTDGKVAIGILDALKDDGETDAIVVHLNLPVLLSYKDSPMVANILDACIAHRATTKSSGSHLVLILRSDGTAETDEARRLHRERAIAAGIPVFENFSMAGRVLAALTRYEAFQASETETEWLRQEVQE
jgi:acyl-CoA synthetase (NDP forming)